MPKGVDEKVWKDAKKAFKKSYDKEPEKDYEWAIVRSIYDKMVGKESYREKLNSLKENISIGSEFDNEGNFINNKIHYLEKLDVLFKESVKFDTIRKAIRNRRNLIIDYTGDTRISKGTRLVEPYVLGTSQAGNKVMRAYQIAGSSSAPDEIPGWRLFLTKNITDFELASTYFSGDRPLLNKTGDKGMIKIDLHASKVRKNKKKS